MARVLMIGAHSAARLLLKNILECAGHAVSMAGSFAEGHQTLCQSGGEAVLTDLHMLESEVLQSIAHLRAEFPPG